MKRNTAITLYNGLMAVRLNKMSEDMTDAVLSNTLAASAVNDTFAKVQEELRKRTIEAIDKDRREAYDNLATKAQALTGTQKAAVQAVMKDSYADIEKARETFMKALNKWLDKDITIDIEPVDRKEFLKAVKEAEQTMTPADTEKLAPMFKGYEAPKVEVDKDELDELLKD